LKFPVLHTPGTSEQIEIVIDGVSRKSHGENRAGEGKEPVVNHPGFPRGSLFQYSGTFFKRIHLYMGCILTLGVLKFLRGPVANGAV